jgi:hypothetical protein
MASRHAIPDRMTDILWMLYQERGMTVSELAKAMGTHARAIRGLFARRGFKVEWWNERELAELYARYRAGEFPASLASSRGRTSADLIPLWQARGWEILERKPPVMPPRIAPELVAAMYADYQAGMTFAQVERKYNRSSKSLRTIFLHRGLEIRESKGFSKFRTETGHFAPYTPKTPEEIEAIIQTAPKLYVPEELKLEWRKWDLARRGDFIRRLRARLASPLDRPQTPFSENVKPFDYASPEAWEIVNVANVGLTSRSAAFNLKIPSQGVIYDGSLWFWSGAGHGYFRGKWTPEDGRPSLHHHLYRLHHGPIPKDGMVTLLDGNPNNLDPSNLFLRTRNDMCRENQARAITRKSREKMEILLTRTQRNNQDHDLLRNLA